MNYLAHARLSFDHAQILVGNMISDFVKGKKKFDFPADVQMGISLHRAIDTYTDTHETTARLKSYFRPQYRLYSGAFADVVYDHFLANDAGEFAEEKDLKLFTSGTYNLLVENRSLLPAAFEKMLPYMKDQDWLFNYRYTAGIEKSFGGLVRRATYLKESDIAFELFLRNYKEMEACYYAFFPSLKKFTASQFQHFLNR